MILKSLSYHPNMHCIWFSYFNIQQLQNITESSWLFIPAVLSINNFAFMTCIFFFWETASKTWIPVSDSWHFWKIFFCYQGITPLKWNIMILSFLSFILTSVLCGYVSRLTDDITPLPHVWYYIKCVALL